MKEQKLSKGWTQERVDRLSKHYDSQPEAAALAEDEAAFAGSQSVESAKAWLIHLAATDKGAQLAVTERALDRLTPQDVIVLYNETRELQDRAPKKAG